MMKQDRKKQGSYREKQKQACGEVSGVVFDIARCSFHDGPGIRTTVFLKGCPLDCLWCHNPESKKSQPESFLNINTGQVSIKGKTMTVNEVMEEVCKDIDYYKESGGGLTISGGEPFNQSEFVKNLAAAAKNKGIHVAVETSGAVSWDKILKSINDVDLYLYDYKHVDAYQLKKFTKGNQSQIEENFRLLIHEKKAVIRRCPIIPRINDTLDHMESICTMSLSYPLIKTELLLYHTLGLSKSRSLGEDYLLPELKSMDNPEDKKRVEEMIRQFPHSKIYLNDKEI